MYIQYIVYICICIYIYIYILYTIHCIYILFNYNCPCNIQFLNEDQLKYVEVLTYPSGHPML